MRVVIGEDDSLYREGLARLLTEAEFEVVAVAATDHRRVLAVLAFLDGAKRG